VSDTLLLAMMLERVTHTLLLVMLERVTHYEVLVGGRDPASASLMPFPDACLASPQQPYCRFDMDRNGMIGVDDLLVSARNLACITQLKRASLRAGPPGGLRAALLAASDPCGLPSRLGSACANVCQPNANALAATSPLARVRDSGLFA